MNVAKSVKVNLGFVIMAVVLFWASACKKSSTQPGVNTSLYGGWHEISLSANTERNIYFESNNGFKMDIVQYGANPITVNTYTGTFTIKNDSLKTNITEEKVMQNNVVISTTPVNMKLYEKGAYRLDKNVLTLKYVTYPADAPVDTEAKFQRILPD